MMSYPLEKFDFALRDTGGNCQAFVAFLENNCEVWVTDPDASSVPDTDGPWMVGVYRSYANGDEMIVEGCGELFETSDPIEFVKYINALFATQAEFTVRAKAEVCAYFTLNRIPVNVRTFGELHDYIDANELGGFCDDAIADALIARFGGRDTSNEGMPDGMLSFMNAVQDDVHLWIDSGDAVDDHHAILELIALPAAHVAAQRDALAALKELVACDDLKDATHAEWSMTHKDKMQIEYDRRHPLAWAAARAALAKVQA